VLQRLRQAPIQRRRNRYLEYIAGARPGRAVIGEEVRRQRRVDELGAPFVPLVEERRDAGFDAVSELLQCGNMVR
jgi:hypothetical protein